MVTKNSQLETLGPYQLGPLIARGGMGEVFKAYDPRLGRSVAIKRVRGDGAVQEARQRLRREARAAAALSHPSIVQVYDILQQEGDDWIVMEWVDGPNLRKRMAAGPLDPLQVTRLGLEIAEGLAAAHSQGILHRDLKTENVLLAPDGRAKILDFGLAKQVGTADGTQLTESGRLLGTCRAMSPEQARGFALDERSDLFSLGVLLYELSTGVSPFRASSITETLLKVCSYAPESIQSLNQEMHYELAQLVEQLLEKAPARRPASAVLVAKQLQRLVRRLEPEGNQATLSKIVPNATPYWLSLVGGVETRKEERGAFNGSIQGSLEAQSTLYEGNEDTSSGTYGDGTRLLTAPSSSWRIAFVVLVGLGLLAATFPQMMTPVFDKFNGLTDRTVSSSTQPLLPDQALQEVHQEAIPRLVVLPFDSLGPDENRYIAAGISEEITQRLASLNGLGVVSRTSARRAVQDGWTAQEIGRNLGVSYLLEGMVNSPPSARIEEAVRVALRLVRVEDDTLIWTQHFERQPEDLLELQSEIAAGVVQRLDIALNQPEQDALALSLTTEPEAYFAYLRGLEYMHSPEYSEEKMLRAVRMFQEAVDIDAQFVEALAGLARMNSHIYFNFDGSDERRRLALLALEAAESLDSERWAVHMARAFYAYRVEGQYDAAIEAFDKAAKLTPHHPEVLQGIGYVRRRQGRLFEATELFLQAFNLDRGNASLADDIAYTLKDMRKYEAAENWFAKTLALSPDLPGTTAQRALNYLNLRGCPEPLNKAAPCTTEGSRKILESSPNRGQVALYSAYLYLDLIDAVRAGPEKADVVIERALERMEDFEDRQYFIRRGVIWREVRLLELAGYSQRARAKVVQLRLELEKQQRAGVGRESDDLEGTFTVPAHLLGAHLGLAYAHLGMCEEAQLQSESAVRMSQHDLYSGPEMRKILALVHLRCGASEKAADIIQDLLSFGWQNPVTKSELALDPLWQELWQLARFRELIESPEVPKAEFTTTDQFWRQDAL